MSVLSRLWRRERPPPEALGRLDSDERVVSWAALDDGSVVVATQRGLWLPATDGGERVLWHLVDRAVWREGTLTLVTAVDAGTDRSDPLLRVQAARLVDEAKVETGSD